MDELGCGEAVVQLHQVQVFWSDTGCFISGSSCVAGESIHIRLHLASLHIGVGSEHRSGYFHSAPLLLRRERAQSFAAYHNGGGGAVTGGAAHEQGVGIGGHGGLHNLFQRKLFLILSQRIHRGMRMVLVGDFGELLKLHAVVFIGVFHACLREHAGHRVGAQNSVHRHDRAVAP